MCSSADASLPPSQATAHGSRSMWIATPSSYRTCTDYSLPISRRTAKDSGHYLLSFLMKKLSDIGILLAGVAKDVRPSIENLLNNADAYGRLFASYKIFVVENDSSDGTKEF